MRLSSHWRSIIEIRDKELFNNLIKKEINNENKTDRRKDFSKKI